MSNIRNPINKPHPPPPPPDLTDGPNVPKGNKQTFRTGNHGGVGGGIASHLVPDPQRPDHRRALGTAPGALTYSGHGVPQGGHGGYGGYGPGGYGGYNGQQPAPPPGAVGYYGSGSPIVQQWRQFFQNQPVEVNIQGDGWVVGAVVVVVHAMQAIGSTVKVRFRRPSSRRSEEDDFPNKPEYIRPFNNPNQ